MSSTETVWVNIYHEFRGACGSAHATRADADVWFKSRIACVEVPYTIGQGLTEKELERMGAANVRP